MFMYRETSDPGVLSSLYTRYPACTGWNRTQGDMYVAVNAGLSNGYPEQGAALFNLAFGVSGWLGGIVNILLVEVYLNYSKDEDERLKKVSILRRKAAGLDVVGESKKED